jgi:hypothetical protein
MWSLKANDAWSCVGHGWRSGNAERERRYAKQ